MYVLLLYFRDISAIKMINKPNVFIYKYNQRICIKYIPISNKLILYIFNEDSQVNNPILLNIFYPKSL